MVIDIRNVQDLRKAIKYFIDNTNDFTKSDALQNSVAAFLDQTGLVNESVDILKDELQCGVCLDIPLHTCLTKCNHIFCAYCVCMWGSQKMECPVCRTTLSTPEPLRKIDTIVVTIMSKHNSQYDSWKKQELNERFNEFYRKFLEASHNEAVIKLEQMEYFNDFDADILRQNLINVAQRFQSLSKKLPCSETDQRKFVYSHFVAFNEFERLRKETRRYFTE